MINQSGSKYNDSLDVKEARIKLEYDFYSKNRKNFSNEANQLMEKIKRGESLSKTETFILLSDEDFLSKHSKQVEEMQKLESIRERIKNGQIDNRDFETLCDMIQFDENTKQQIYNAFKERNILVDSYEKER